MHTYVWHLLVLCALTQYILPSSCKSAVARHETLFVFFFFLFRGFIPWEPENTILASCSFVVYAWMVSQRIESTWKISYYLCSLLYIYIYIIITVKESDGNGWGSASWSAMLQKQKVATRQKETSIIPLNSLFHTFTLGLPCSFVDIIL